MLPRCFGSDLGKMEFRPTLSLARAVLALLSCSTAMSYEVVPSTALPRSWDASQAPFAIEADVDPPSPVTRILVVSDHHMKRPKDLEISLLRPGNSANAPLEIVSNTTAVYPASHDICGTHGDQKCEYPKTPTSTFAVDFHSDLKISRVRVAVLTPMNVAGTPNDHIIIQEVVVQTPTQTTTPSPTGNVLLEMFSAGVDCGTLPNLTENNLVHKVELPDINIPQSSKNNPKIFGFQTGNNWAARFTAKLLVSGAGQYTFALSLGDADTAVLTVSDIEIIRSGCAWSSSYEGSIYLTAGLHAIQVLYADDGWTDKVILSYRGVDTNEQLLVVPSTRLVGLHHVMESANVTTRAILKPARTATTENIEGTMDLTFANQSAADTVIADPDARGVLSVAIAAMIDGVSAYMVLIKDIVKLPTGSGGRRLNAIKLHIIYEIFIPEELDAKIAKDSITTEVETFRTMVNEKLVEAGVEGASVVAVAIPEPVITSRQNRPKISGNHNQSSNNTNDSNDDVEDSNDIDNDDIDDRDKGHNDADNITDIEGDRNDNNNTNTDSNNKDDFVSGNKDNDHDNNDNGADTTKTRTTATTTRTTTRTTTNASIVQLPRASARSTPPDFQRIPSAASEACVFFALVKAALLCLCVPVLQ